MSRLIQVILFLHIPFYTHGMMPDDVAVNNPTQSPSFPDLSDHGDLDELLSMENIDSVASSSDASDPYGALASVIGISDPASERGVVAGFVRFVAKRTGYLDVSGVSTNPTERNRTSRILECHADMLSPEQEIDTQKLKQFLERQAAAEMWALRLLKKLQAFTHNYDIPEIMDIIDRAQRLIDIHANSTLCKPTSEALKGALEVARQKSREKLAQSDLESST